MKSSVVRTAVALLVGLSALVGCEGPTSNAADLDRVANDMLDVAEATLPAMADDLGATLTNVVSGAAREGGSEGTTPHVSFHVWARMAASEPTQAELEQALIGAGFTDLVPPESGRPSDAPSATAISADGAMLISVTYRATGDVVANFPDCTILVSFSNVDPLRVSNGTFDAFTRDYARAFDQSLVHDTPDIAALRQQADSTLDVAEEVFPALADRLGATLKSAGLSMRDGAADATQASVTFWVEAWMTGPAPTQAALEQALIDEGFADIVSRRDPNPSDIPYARAISADGAVEIYIYYSNLVDPDGWISFTVGSVVGVLVTDATLRDFRRVFTRDFDQSLVDSSGN